MRLWMGQHHLDALHRINAAHQVVANQQTDLANNMQRRVEQQVHGARHNTFGVVFYWHHTKIGPT